MISAKRGFFFTLIEKEVAALRSELAQERNYEQKKDLKKLERTYARKEEFQRDGSTSRPNYVKDVHAGRTFNVGIDRLSV